MRDNVTPFRPRKPPPKPKSRLNIASHRGRAVAVQALTLLTFVLRFIFVAAPWSWIALGVAITAVAIAASNRHSAMPWAQTHHEHAIRTLLIAYAITTLSNLFFGLVLIPSHLPPNIGGPLNLVAIGIPLLVLLWVLIRAGVGLVLAIMRKPIWHPRGWLL